jgi:hypothetical protein
MGDIGQAIEAVGDVLCLSDQIRTCDVSEYRFLLVTWLIAL